MTDYLNDYLDSLATGELVAVDTFMAIRPTTELEETLDMMYPNEEDREQWQSC